MKNITEYLPNTPTLSWYPLKEALDLLSFQGLKERVSRVASAVFRLIKFIFTFPVKIFFCAWKTTRKIEDLEDYIKELSQENNTLLHMNQQLAKKLDKIEGGQHDETSELFS